MTDKTDDLTHLERIARAASPGPWETEEDKYLIGPNCEGVRYRESKMKHAGFSVENALHIATFNPQTVLDLIERVRAAEGETDEASTRVGLFEVANQQLHDRIAELEAENGRLKEALAPFADLRRAAALHTEGGENV